MINFIIYEDNKVWQEHYKKAILKVIEDKKEKYNILIIDKYTNEVKRKIKSLIGKNIFLLNMEVPGKSGLDLAKEIRNTGDWTSQMILITSKKHWIEKCLTSKVLMLDFINKNKNMESKLKETLIIALQIHSCNKSFSFTYNNDFYQIPYDAILYFEKNLNNNYTSIVTKNNIYKIKESIKSLESEFIFSPTFFKTHQSCIVNLKNIEKVDFSKNIIYFSNRSIDLLSRNNKKELKEKMENGIYQ